MRKSMYIQDPLYRQWLHTPQWHGLRARKLVQQPWCERCLLHYRRTPATEVHHRDPVMAAPTEVIQKQRMFSIQNLVSLCHDCHAATHRELGKQTKEENDRRKYAILAEQRRMMGITKD